MALIARFAPWALGLFISATFLDSLRFKFTGHPTPRHIFTTLRDWSGIGLFYPAGPWIIGLGELLSSVLLIAAPLVLVFMGKQTLAGASQAAGALIALGIMTGAIVFHLFTPLGIETPTAWDGDTVVAQGPFLFIAACGSWLSAVIILLLRKGDVLALKP
ncbi:MAG: hypothetical protein PVI23_12545 [Maricaulaceae bacterium]